MILGAIWTAAAKVYVSHKITEAQKELMTVTLGVINSMRGQPWPAATSVDYTSTFITLGVVPQQYVYSPSVAGHPWNAEGFHIWSAPLGTPGDPTKTFEVSFYGPSLAGCINLINLSINCQIGSVGCPIAVVTDMSGIIRLPDATTGWAGYLLPEIEADCVPNAGGGSVEFMYYL